MRRRSYPLVAMLLAGMAALAPPARAAGPGAGPAGAAWHPSAPDGDTLAYRAAATTGVGIAPGAGHRCPVPAPFRDRILQYVTVFYRTEPLAGAKDGDRHPGPAWIGLRVRPGPPPGRAAGGAEWLDWSDPFGPGKLAPPASERHPKRSVFLGFQELTGGRPVESFELRNRQGPATQGGGLLRVHRVELTFLHEGDRVPAGRLTRFRSAERLNSIAWRFRLDTGRGLPLPPGHSFEFELPGPSPGEGETEGILCLVLKHRKDPALLRAAPDGADPGSRDPDPAYVLVEARDARTGRWMRWADRYGAAKYSEPREADNPEDETLHNGLRTFGRIRPDRVRLTNVGRGDPRRATARVHELQVVLSPDRRGAAARERLLTPETAFNAPERGRPIPLLGGGPRLGGRFPHALPLGPGYRERAAQVARLPPPHRFPLTLEPPPPARRDGLGRLRIPLPPGRHLLLCEFAAGDLDLTSLEANKDGFFGRAGRAEMSVWLRRRAGASPGAFRDFPMAVRHNVGMAGVISLGAPADPEAAGPLRPGDSLVVAVNFDVAFLMGYRILTRRAPGAAAAPR